MAFVLESSTTDSPFVQEFWQAQSVSPGAFVSTAASHWELVVTRRESKTTLTVRGPETKATQLAYSEGGEWVGIRFRLGTFIPLLSAGGLVNRAVTLPAAGIRSFWLSGAAWPYPEYGQAEAFVDRLVREGLLVRDPVVAAARQGQPPGLSTRSIQRRFIRATGLTQSTVRQIERAHQAMALLQRGVPILDVVDEAGYYDQPHLTRALRRWLGQTPTQIISPRSDAESSL